MYNLANHLYLPAFLALLIVSLLSLYRRRKLRRGEPVEGTRWLLLAQIVLAVLFAVMFGIYATHQHP